MRLFFFFFFQAEDGIRDFHVTGVQTCALPILVHEREHLTTASEILRGFGKGETTVEEHMRKLTVPVTGGAKLLAEVIRELDARGIEIDDIGLRRPTLDDVFISLTGHAAERTGDNGNGGTGDAGDPRQQKETAK